MNYCTKCGTALSENKNFCTKCGTKINNKIVSGTSSSAETADLVASTISAHVQETQQSRVYTPKPMTKNQKLGLLVTASIAACILAFYLIGSSLTSKERVVGNFKKAMTEKKASDVASMLTSSDKRLIIDEAGVKTLFTYFDKNPSSLNSVLNSLDNFSSVISVKKDGKKLLFFDKYIFDIKPVFFNIDTNYKGTKIFVGDKEIITATKEDFTAEIGPFMPGIHNIKAILKGEYVDLEKSVEVPTLKYTSSDAAKIPVDLYIEASTLQIESNYPDAKVFINGKDTGLNTHEVSKLGPVSMDGKLKLYIQKDLPFGACKSKEVTIKNNYVELNLEASDELKDTVAVKIGDFFKSQVEAFNALDASKLALVSDDLKEQIVNDIDNYTRWNTHYKGTLDKVLVDLDSIKIINESTEAAESYLIEAGVVASLDDTAYYEGQTEITTRKHDDPFKITLWYNSTKKQWIINTKNGWYSFNNNTKNKKEIVPAK